jgi:hypothetical protein
MSYMKAAAPDAIPGAAEARAALDAARQREDDLHLRLQAAEQVRWDAAMARAALVAKIAAGEALPASAAATAAGAVADAEAGVALLQDALRGAGEATKRAQYKISAVLRSELRRRYPMARAAADAAEARRVEALAEFGRWDVLASELLRAAGDGSMDVADVEFFLDQSADFAAAPERGAA